MSAELSMNPRSLPTCFPPNGKFT